MTNPHVMVDLETMSSGSNAAIVSIGAVKFDPNGQHIADAFHVGVTLESCLRHGLDMSASTVMWWMHPDRDAARTALFGLNNVDLWEALEGFKKWFGPDSLPVWGNGATFDNVILRNAYTRTDIPCPWNFWDDCCYRTYKRLAPDVAIVREGTHHSALDDAISQAKHLQAILKHKGITL